MKLDIKDRKILYELDKNSRQSFSEIAKKVQLSKEVVNYRVKNLIDEGIISRFYTELNFSKLGLQVIKAHLQFQNLTKEVEDKIYDYFKDANFPTWIVSCSGKWDMIFGIGTQNVMTYNWLLTDIYNKFSKYILSKEIIMNTALRVYNKKWLTKDSKEDVFTIVGGPISQPTLDEIDYTILMMLSDDSRVPLTDIANKCKATPNAIRYRVKELESKGIINAYRISLNLKQFDREFCKAFIYLHQKTEEKERKLITFCEMHPDIIAVVQCVGSWDFEIEFEVEDFDQFHNIMREIRNKFDFVRSYESVIITKEFGINYMGRTHNLINFINSLSQRDKISLKRKPKDDFR